MKHVFPNWNRLFLPLAAFVLCAVTAGAQVPEHHYFQFNTSGGNFDFDAAYPGLGSNATHTGTIFFPGKLGNSGIGSGIVTNNGNLDTNTMTIVSGSWTIEFWIYDVEPTNINYCMGDSSAGGLRAFSGGIAGSHDNLILRGPLTDTLIVGGAPLSTWSHVAWVYDDVALTITPYLNGVALPPVAQSSNIVMNGTSATGIKVGGYASSLFRGRMDEFRFWGHARSTTQVSANVNQEITTVISSFPYTEDFDTFGNPAGNGNTVVANGWNQDDDDGTGPYGDWYFGISTSSQTGPETNGLGDRTSGNGVFGFIEDSFSSNPVINLRSPYFDLDTVTQPKMRLFVNAHDYSNGGNFNPLFIDVLTPSGVVSNIASVTADTGDLWQPLVANLSPYAGQNIRIQIRSTNASSPSFWCDTAIDDFQIIDAKIPSLIGQAPGIGAATLDINGATNVWGDSVGQGPLLNGPYSSTASQNSSAFFDMNGEPDQGILLISGPLNPQVASFPGFGQFDIGMLPLNSGGVPANLILEADGVTSPVLGLNKIFITNNTGQAAFLATIPNLPLGSFATFQCIILNSVNIIAFSNAVSLTIN